MRTIDYLDVLVVYSAGVAHSASIEDSLSKHPFLLQSNQSNYNLSYAYFLKTCRKHGLNAGFTTSTDVIGPGLCSSYWRYESETWIKIDHQAKSTHIFDKVSPVSITRSAERQLLLSEKSIKPFNDKELFEIFFDKFLTYKQLSMFSVPTIALYSTDLHQIQLSLRKLRSIYKQYNEDYNDQIIMKDRFGSGGNNVFKIDHNYSSTIRTLMLQNPDVKFVIQPFLLFDKGYKHNGKRTATDIRLIYLRGKLLQSYIRTAKADEFRCNEHQGGELQYITQAGIPKPIRILAGKIVKRINKPQSMYALDFVMSNSNRPYFIEGNTGPGLDWDVTKKVNECKSKLLIDSIILDFKSRLTSTVPHITIKPYMFNIPLKPLEL